MGYESFTDRELDEVLLREKDKAVKFGKFLMKRGLTFEFDKPKRWYSKKYGACLTMDELYDKFSAESSEASKHVTKIMKALEEAKEIHEGRKRGKSFDDFIAEL